MTRSLIRFVAGLAVCLAAACGPPSKNDLCNQSCDSLRRCNYLTEVQTANCKTDCENNKGKSSDDDAALQRMCKNAGDIRSAQLSCYSNTSCKNNVAEYGLAVAACLIQNETNCTKTQ